MNKIIKSYALWSIGVILNLAFFTFGSFIFAYLFELLRGIVTLAKFENKYSKVGTFNV